MGKFLRYVSRSLSFKYQSQQESFNHDYPNLFDVVCKVNGIEVDPPVETDFMVEIDGHIFKNEDAIRAIIFSVHKENDWECNMHLGIEE